jgi:hypothetical protein
MHEQECRKFVKFKAKKEGGEENVLQNDCKIRTPLTSCRTPPEAGAGGCLGRLKSTKKPHSSTLVETRYLVSRAFGEASAS